ncbi:hypothetical protein DFS34DRAFT_622166 [Phlyctochytrium arcticum]|nr:hypothetical protein DFS34DRAFT_622166 [Phlyctochytrium arcticum]
MSANKRVIRAPEFPLFPFRAWRVNPPVLEGTAPVAADPWAKREAWRYDKFFSVRNRVRNMAPGLSIGLAAFGVYVAYDRWYHTKGPGREEKEKWDQWMRDREQRLAQEHKGH